MKQLFNKWFNKKEHENPKIYVQEIEKLILTKNNQELLKIANEIGIEKIKCNSSNQLAALHWAAGSGNLDFVKFLLSDEVNEDPNITRENNFTPLHAASMHGFSAIVELLIDNGANVNIQTDPQKYAPIHSASFGGHLETIKLLIDSGADISLKNYRDELPIDTAKRQEQKEVIEYLEKLK